MRQNVVVAGVGMTRFGKHLDRSLKSLAGEAIKAAVADAGITLADIPAAWMANAAAAVITGQVCVPGETVLRSLGVGRIPVINVENACASASTALNQAATMLSLGAYRRRIRPAAMRSWFTPTRPRRFPFSPAPSTSKTSTG